MQIEAGSWSGGGYNYGYNGMLKEGIGKDIYNTQLFFSSPSPLEEGFRMRMYSCFLIPSYAKNKAHRKPKYIPN